MICRARDEKFYEYYLSVYLHRIQIFSYVYFGPGVSIFSKNGVFVGPLPRVRPRNGILALVLLVLVLVVPLRSEFIGEL